jgi:ABC-type phosphate transport system substrate-binding protein
MFLRNYIILILCLFLSYSCKTRNSVKETENLPATTQKIITGSVTINGAYALAPLARNWALGFMTGYLRPSREKIRSGYDIKATH